jgi:hypothetical protein
MGVNPPHLYPLPPGERRLISKPEAGLRRAASMERKRLSHHELRFGPEKTPFQSGVNTHYL